MGKNAFGCFCLLALGAGAWHTDESISKSFHAHRCDKMLIFEHFHSWVCCTEEQKGSQISFWRVEGLTSDTGQVEQERCSATCSKQTPFERVPGDPSFAMLQVTVALSSKGITRSCRAARSRDKGDAPHSSSLGKLLLCRKPFIYGLIIMNSASLHLNTLVSRGAQHMLLPVQPRRKPHFATPGTYKPLLQQGITRQP